MKKRNINQKGRMLPISIFMTLIFVAIISCIGQETKVFGAYTLRINGHAAEAKVLLQQISSENPENALAWYELCRTTQQLGMANPRVIKESLDEALNCINKAINIEPKNAWYLSYKGGIETSQFYLAIHIQTGNENAPEYLEKLEETYNAVFKLDPSYYENKLTLVEFFGGLPVEMGGNPEKAEKYARELEEADIIAGAKAREILMPEDADYEKFWKEIINENPDNADAIQALGRVYLLTDKIDDAKMCYQKAIELDPSKNDLYLDLGRYYLMMAMQNSAVLDSVAPLIKEQFNKYLNFIPEPINPMKAWTYSFLSLISRRTGNLEEADRYIGMAKELDPFYSPAFGKPGKAIYCPPDVVVHDQGYYLTPF